MDIGIILFTLAGVAALGIMSPGPDFIAVSHSAITSNRKLAASVATGVVIGNAVWAGAALFGVGALFILFPTFLFVFKLIGGLYLIWLGLSMLRGANKPLESSDKKAANNVWKSFLKGFTTTLANPKAVIYYASALTAVAPPGASFGLLLLMVLIVLAVAAFWFACVVLFLSTPQASSFYKNIKIYLESVFGSLIMLFGAKQIFDN